ncbi:hypothetical protein J6590_020981 [Homalodisca vitripennis]|nr:hypothetical protein J6590_020981 [Homalodisca vitripennis]
MNHTEIRRGQFEWRPSLECRVGNAPESVAARRRPNHTALHYTVLVLITTKVVRVIVSRQMTSRPQKQINIKVIEILEPLESLESAPGLPQYNCLSLTQDRLRILRNPI